MKQGFLAGILLVIMLFSVIPVQSLEEGKVTIFYRTVTVYAPAVARTSEGLTGVVSVITVTVQNGTGCSGKVFVETSPLTQIDMQGSARLAVMVAGSLTGIDTSNYDFFFVVKTPAPIIGGPSAGGVMTVATIAALEGWKLDNATMMTGMIDPDGSIGPVGGIPEKIDAAHSVGARRFLIPKGQMNVYRTVTKTTNIGGIISITQERVPVNLSKYASKYGIEVVEVEDISDAVFYFTGHSFESPSTNETITTENYTSSMKPLAESLLKEANQSFNDARELFNSSKNSIPDSFFSPYRSQVEEILSKAEKRLNDSKDAYEENLYYSSTSKAFQSLIYSRFVTYASEYYTSDDKASYLDNLFRSLQSMVTNKSGEAKNASISGMISLQGVGAAQKRAFEAENSLDEAKSYRRRGDYLDTLYDLAFAFERSRSVEWWLNISLAFEESGKVNSSMLRDTADRYLRLAIQAKTYSQIILNEIGENPQLLSDADSLISKAEDEIDDYPAAALFLSLEALSKANLALELIDGVTEDKIERTKEKAAVAIEESRKLGIEPMLAVSYFEFAESLEDESPTDAIVHYRYAQMIAGVFQFMTNQSTEKESRFEGVPPHSSPTKYVILIDFQLLVVVAGISALLFIIGIVLILRDRKFKRDFPPEIWIPRSMQEYYRKH